MRTVHVGLHVRISTILHSYIHTRMYASKGSHKSGYANTQIWCPLSPARLLRVSVTPAVRDGRRKQRRHRAHPRPSLARRWLSHAQHRLVTSINHNTLPTDHITDRDISNKLMLLFCEVGLKDWEEFHRLFRFDPVRRGHTRDWMCNMSLKRKACHAVFLGIPNLEPYMQTLYPCFMHRYAIICFPFL